MLAGIARADPDQRRRSFATLVAAYWKPVYKHLRIRWRKSNEEAKDLAQAFFAIAMEKEFFSGYDPSRARFRTFLRTCLDRFIANEAKAAGRLKRGGGTELLPLDFDAAEAELSRAATVDVERLFDHEWLRNLMALSLAELREICASRGKDVHWALFERYDLVEEREQRPTYGALAQELNIAVTDVTNHLAFVRRELRRVVLEKLREITADESEFRAEARFLLGIDVA